MKWELIYLPEVEIDYQNLTRHQQIITDKAVKRVKENPLPNNEGGYGKPLGHKHGRNLTGYLKIKLQGEGIRIVYKLVRSESKMLVIVIGIREDDKIYEIAQHRILKYKL